MCIFQREKVAEVRDRRSAPPRPQCGTFGSGEGLPWKEFLTHSSLGGRGGSANLTALAQMVKENGSLSRVGDLAPRACERVCKEDRPAPQAAEGGAQGPGGPGAQPRRDLPPTERLGAF